jgi:5-amino-6-(5-phosphoribosylamino)uracil reductase
LNNRTDRPRVIISVAITLDGYTDTIDQGSLRISSEQDLIEVHRLRARSDAILVGAETLRADDCRLTVRYGQAGSTKPMRITLTRSGHLDFNARFFALDGAKKIIFCPKSIESALQKQLPAQSTLVAFDGDSCSLSHLMEALETFGVKTLMIEGGASVISQFLHQRLVDCARIAISPQIVGSAGKNRLFDAAPTTGQSGTNWQFVSVEHFDETVVILYEIKNGPKS